MIAFSCIAIYACTESSARYVDLNTGEAIEVEKDPETGFMVNKATHRPVKLYVDRRSNDTIYGYTGEVANTKLRKLQSGKWVYLGAEEFKYKREKDAEKLKIGDDDYKYKRDGNAYKIKKGDYYKKDVEKDGDVTIVSGNKKIKIDGETGERKVKVDD